MNRHPHAHTLGESIIFAAVGFTHAAERTRAIALLQSGAVKLTADERRTVHDAAQSVTAAQRTWISAWLSRGDGKRTAELHTRAQQRLREFRDVTERVRAQRAARAILEARREIARQACGPNIEHITIERGRAQIRHPAEEGQRALNIGALLRRTAALLSEAPNG